MKKLDVVGSWPALVTPFNDDDEVDYDILRSLVDFQVANGSDGILLLGSTSEATLLSPSERTKIIDESLAAIRPSQDALYRYFKDVAEAVDLPLVIYNNPSRTGVNVEPETVARLAHLENIVALKEAGPNPYGILRVVELTRGRLNVLCCDCPTYALIFPVLASGGKGTSNVTGSIAPGELVAISKP
jgi:4-hydroxy-tetrahydrodipicolinate synthase